MSPNAHHQRTRPRLVHLTTTDMSLDWLLGPQLQAFADAGYEVIGVSAPGDHVAELERSGIRHVAIDEFTRSSNPWQDLRAFVSLVRILRSLRPDVLHTHNPKPGVMGRIAGRLTRVPLIVNTQHGLYAQPDDRRVRRFGVYTAERIAAAFGHLELVQNEEDVDTLVNVLRIPRRKVRLLGNGIDLERFRPSDDNARAGARLRAEWGLDPDHIVCGLVGRLVTEKGLHEVREAAARLRGTPRIRFVWVGPTDDSKADAIGGPDLAAAEQQGVMLVGQRNDMPACYCAFDLFVTASWREGFPRAVMEASAMGLAIVATDIRGNRQAVVDGVTGTLVPVRDPESLATAVDNLVEQADERRSRGAAARRLACAEFDQARVIRRTLAAYRGLDSM